MASAIEPAHDHDIATAEDNRTLDELCAAIAPVMNFCAENQDLEELLRQLYKNELSPEIILAIQHHVNILGPDVCNAFIILHNLVVRQEALVRKRWIKKSPAQRRDILLGAWPDMPRDFRPDDGFNGMPYMNLENLTKPKPFLVFLNARGRTPPWTFASSEESFSILARMSFCKDKEFCFRHNVQFTERPEPGVYGRYLLKPAGSGHSHGTLHSFEKCARSGILILSIQSRILNFLVACTVQILHDVIENDIGNLWGLPMVKEPAEAELLESVNNGHTSFSDVMMSAPYRGPNSLNFSKLQGYIIATFDTQKEHVWALREDPSYFSDTVAEYEEHTSQENAGLSSRLPGKSAYRNLILKNLVEEAYATLAGWSELCRHSSDFNRSIATRKITPDTMDSAYAIQKAARWLKDRLAHTISISWSSLTHTRKVLDRDPSKITEGQRRMLDIFDSFKDSEPSLQSPMSISSMLQTIEKLMKDHSECAVMVTSRLLSLLGDLSIAAECLRQVKMWEWSPVIRSICDCSRSERDDWSDAARLYEFQKWVSTMEGFTLPIHQVYPHREKLSYPVHKRRNREQVGAMRQAEANLDKFWEGVDALYKGKTGTSQHEIIRDCLTDGGEMQRTAPWIEPATAKAALKKDPDKGYAYQPLSRMVHDKTLQITGAFDKLSMEEKSKIKTRGSPMNEDIVGDHLAVQPVEATHEAEKPFYVDQRTHKVFKTIFYTPTTESGDLPKVVKWAEFKRAMMRMGFAVEKLQGSAWQFTPGDTSNIDRNIQFHEPHPESDIPYVMAKRFGRRLGRVYGWSAESFKLA